VVRGITESEWISSFVSNDTKRAFWDLNEEERVFTNRHRNTLLEKNN